MEIRKRKTTLVGVMTLILGLGLGLAMGVWSTHNSKASSAPANSVSSQTKTDDSDSRLQTTDPWDPFVQMERMREEIDRAIRRATEQFELGSGPTTSRTDAGYSSAFDLLDRKDHFELRAYLPDVQASDVKVRLDNDQTLHVSVSQRKQEVKKNGEAEARVTELGQYEQVVTLPEPVKGSDMKIERNGHEMVITIPKARDS
jgi:HSP20 family molecular chaperone IbpA